MSRFSRDTGLIALAVLLLVGVPWFVRMPVWVDATYHDLSAWNILHGGTHYRDVFETNLPGMVWIHCILRPLIGWSHEAIRITDLFVVASIAMCIFIHLRRSGAPIDRRIWFLVAVTAFYLFETEFIHCQRDGWMLLPATAAMMLRGLACTRPSPWRALLEGIFWGFAVWIKPHVLLPAFLVWLVSLRLQSRRDAVRDAGGLLAGGLLAGVAGTAWLIATDTWSPMWDVMLNWNGEYYQWTAKNIWHKVRVAPIYFAPFSLIHWVAVPVALMQAGRRDAGRAVLAAMYLGWLAQATIVQKEFDYAHSPPTILGFAVLATIRIPVGPVFLVWCIAGGLINQIAENSEWLPDLKKRHETLARMSMPDYPLMRWERLRLWPRCWYDSSWELKDRLGFHSDIFCAPNWTELERTAEFLEARGIGDGDLICWHDATHPLYVRLGIRPAIRYPHVLTALKFKSKQELIRREVFDSRARFVVSDLGAIGNPRSFDDPTWSGPCTELPVDFPASYRDIYPWNQPPVFRAGRYIVHEIRNPRGAIIIDEAD